MKLHLTGLGEFPGVDEDIVALRATDASGSFGILPGHADLLTVLETGVVSWRRIDGAERHCAVRRGVLRVHAGNRIDIASREAIVDDDLQRLESTVLSAFRAHEEAESSSRTHATQIELKTLRELIRYLQPPRGGVGEFR